MFLKVICRKTKLNRFSCLKRKEFDVICTDFIISEKIIQTLQQWFLSSVKLNKMDIINLSIGAGL